MACFATLLVILSVSCAAEVKGVSKRADTKDDVCSENSKGLSFLRTEGLLNLHQKSAILRSQGTGVDKYDYFIGICTNPNPELVTDESCMVIQLNSTDSSKGTGICLGKKAGAQLTDTLSLGWVELTYSGGAHYGSHCDQTGRVSRIFFFCDSAAGDGTPEFIEENRDDNYCYYLFNWPTSHICNDSVPTEPHINPSVPTAESGLIATTIVAILMFLCTLAMAIGIVVYCLVRKIVGQGQTPFCVGCCSGLPECHTPGYNLVCQCNRGRGRLMSSVCSCMCGCGGGSSQNHPLSDAEDPRRSLNKSYADSQDDDEDRVPLV